MLDSNDNTRFAKNFKEFIKPFTCQSHKQNPTFVCIDQNCNNRGLICSICLTIVGSHKNHDSIQIHEFLAHCIKSNKNNQKKNQLSSIIRQIDQAYQDLLKILTQFHQNLSSIIKEYISKKNEIHKSKQEYLLTENSLETLKNCKFKSIQQMNKTLNILINRISSTLTNNKYSQQKIMTDTQLYLDDLNYQIQNISNKFKDIQQNLQNILTVKNTSPLVIVTKPLLNSPKFYQNNQIVYIGQLKNDKPNGKGITFYKNSKKIVYGEFHNGQLEKQGELYFQSGDYYLGEFKFDKKEGRGVYYWTGKDQNVFEGQFKAGKRHGRGTFWWADGSWYQGQFKDGNQEGYGTLYRGQSHKEYEGQWHHGMFEGYGKQYFENGERYEGQFKQDKFDGQGTFYKDDSTIYGIWKENELSVVNMVKSTLTDK